MVDGVHKLWFDRMQAFGRKQQKDDGNYQYPHPH